MRKLNKGFTLIELLVVIAIIGLLSTLAVVALNSARQRSRDAKRVADIRQIQTALELSFSEYSLYPDKGSGVIANAIELGVAASTKVLCGLGVPALPEFVGASGDCVTGSTTYMGLVPQNPSPTAPLGEGYKFQGDGKTYVIQFELEGKTGQLEKGLNCATPDGISTVLCPVVL